MSLIFILLFFGVFLISLPFFRRFFRGYNFDLKQVAKKKNQLKDKVVVITGPTSGIGKQLAKALVAFSPRLVIACRNKEKGKKLIQKLVSMGLEEKKITLILIDMSDLSTVTSFCKQFREKFNRLDILVNNAGISDLFGTYKETKNEFESVFQINYLGHFLLTISLIDLLERVNGKIINITSRAHHFFPKREDLDDFTIKYQRFFMGRYSRSKLCQILFSKEMNRRYKNVSTYACYPGFMYGKATVHYLPKYFQFIGHILKFFLKTNRDGIQTQLKLVFLDDRSIENKIENCYFEEGKISRPSKLACDKILAMEVFNKSLKFVKKFLE